MHTCRYYTLSALTHAHLHIYTLSTLTPAHLQMLHLIGTHACTPARYYTLSTLTPAHLQMLHLIGTHACTPADITPYQHSRRAPAYDTPYRHSRIHTCIYYTLSTLTHAHLHTQVVVRTKIRGTRNSIARIDRLHVDIRESPVKPDLIMFLKSITICVVIFRLINEKVSFLSLPNKLILCSLKHTCDRTSCSVCYSTQQVLLIDNLCKLSLQCYDLNRFQSFSRHLRQANFLCWH